MTPMKVTNKIFIDRPGLGRKGSLISYVESIRSEKRKSFKNTRVGTGESLPLNLTRWSTRPTQNNCRWWSLFSHMSSVSPYFSKSCKPSSSENSDRYWRDFWSGQEDHWWHLSCLFPLFLEVHPVIYVHRWWKRARVLDLLRSWQSGFRTDD